MQPFVELGRAGRERGDGVAVELSFVGVRDLAGLVQLHQPVGEHLGVHPVAATGPIGEQRGDEGWDGADAGLKRGAVGDVGAGELGDREVGVGTGRIRKVDRLGLAFEEDVDLVDVKAVGVLRGQAVGSGVGVGVLDDQEAVGIRPGAMQLVDRRPRVER